MKISSAERKLKFDAHQTIRGKRPSSSTAKRRNNNTSSRVIDDDDRSTSSSSTASTFSYIQSIIQRRRHIPPELMSTVEEHENDDEEGTTNGVLFHPAAAAAFSSRRAEESRLSINRSKTKRKRRRKSPRNNNAHPLILLTIIGLASNWMANRILNSLFLDELEDVDQIIGEVNANGESQRESLDHNSLGETSIEVDRSIPVRTYSGTIQYDQLQNSRGINAYDNNNADANENAAEQYNGQLIDHFPDASNIQKGREHQQSDTLNVTKRFANLRERLLSIYSEKLPPETQQPYHNSSSVTLHPLFNDQSPQYKALNWLANIDRLRLRHYDPGLIQRYVLAVMYFSTGGPPVTEETDLSQKRKGPWRNPTNFLAPTHECDWKSRIIDGAGRGGGIRRCDKNKTVVEISIYNELQGTIPSELGRLWNLRTLYLGRNHLTGTIPTELGMIQKLSSLSLQWNDLRGYVPAEYMKNMLTLRALQLEGNEKMSGNLHKHSLICQMRNKYRGPTPREQERYTGRRVLRVLTATCIPSGSVVGGSDRLQCACCTECFGKTTKDLIY